MNVKSLRYRPELDGIRGMAVLIVLLAHASVRLAPEVMRNGWVGVNVFFVLSGFLITQILLAEKMNTGRLDLPAFVMRRGLRIWPLYFVVLLLYALVLPNFDSAIFGQVYVDSTEKTFATYWNSLWSHFVFLQNYLVEIRDVRLGLGIYWSLAVEEHYYLFWPLLIWIIPVRFLKGVLFLACIVSIAMRFNYIDPGLPLSGVGHYTHTNLASLGLGSMLAILNLEGKLAVRPALQQVLMPLGLGLLLFSLSSQYLPPSPYKAIVVYVAAVLGSGFLIWGALFGSKILSADPLVRIGKVSFGIYLLHPLVIGLTRYLLGPETKTNWLISIPGILLAAIAAWIVAEVSYKFYESPFLQIKKRYSRTE